MKTIFILLAAFLLSTTVYSQQTKQDLKQAVIPEFRCDSTAKAFYLYIVNGTFFFHTLGPGEILKTIDSKDIRTIEAIPKGDPKNLEYARKTGKYSSKVLDILFIETSLGAFPTALYKK